MKQTVPLFLAITTSAFAGETNPCIPEMPSTCYTTSDCGCHYCMGPAQQLGNAPVRPYTCNGDFVISVSGFYWNAHQDGMEYALDNAVAVTTQPAMELSTLAKADYLTPKFKWEFGFKLGLGYNTTCDSWDLSARWTNYRGKAHDSVEAEEESNHTLIPLWSAFANVFGSTLFASRIDTDWHLQMNLIDLTLGREFWTSRYLTLRPHIGLRLAYLNQDFDIEHKGGSWSEVNESMFLQDGFNNLVELENNFRGVGVRAGIETVWHFGCGWGLTGQLAASLPYGRFTINHSEGNTQATSPFTKTKIFETQDSFQASRAMLDARLGLQYMTMFCECTYGLAFELAWENHLFFHQNQMWRVTRIGDYETGTGVSSLPNTNGENNFAQARGSLDTQGWTLTATFSF